jgi:hypothetical protein
MLVVSFIRFNLVIVELVSTTSGVAARTNDFVNVLRPAVRSAILDIEEGEV